MNKIIAWVEIPTVDFYRAVKFYNQILETELVPLDWGEEKMACLPNNEGSIFYSKEFKPSKSGVIVSFNAGNSIDKMIDLVKAAGGKIEKPKTKIEAEGRGYFALFIDSEGNQMGLYGNA